MIVHGHAKVNIGVDITGISPDGYHALDMIMQRIASHIAAPE